MDMATLSFSLVLSLALPSPDGGPAEPRADVLLITSTKLAPAWQAYADWKTRLGKRTVIATVEQIAGDSDNVQESIRRFVRRSIDERGTRWVVLGGDCLPQGGLVPGGHTTVHRQEPRGIPTDIVYISPTNWDADGDGIYGEWKDDADAITYPDGTVGLGRIPVRTPADVAAFTEKVIAYESSYPTDAFATRMIYTCTDRPAYPKVRNSWDGYVSKAWEQGDVGRFFSAETPWDEAGKPGSHDLSANNLVELVNAKSTGKLHIHGHGHLPAWVLERSRFTAQHAGELKNAGAYPLITTVSCNTGEYDSRQDPSIVESLLRLPNAGSVAVVAPVRTGKPHFHSRSDFRLMVQEGKLDGTTMTMTRYWSNGLGSASTTGHALMQAKAAMVEDARRTPGYHLCICELNLLGDPTLDMRAATPAAIDVTVADRIGLGAQTLEVKTDAPGAVVCAWKGDEVYVVATADGEGVAALEVDPETAGELLLTVSGPSLNAAPLSVAVVASDR